MDIEENFAGRSEIAFKIVSGELLLHDNKTASKGKIWQIFAKVTNREGVELDFVCCKICEKVYKYNHTQTSKLCRHSCYVDRFANANETEISIVEEEKPKIQIMNIVAVTNLTQLLTKWIIQNCDAYHLLQTEGLKAIFQELLVLGAKFGSDLDLGKFLPSLSVLTNNIADVYSRLLAAIKQEITSVKKDGFGLTAHILSDNLLQDNYIALTIHYSINGVLTYRLLGFQLLEGESITDTAANIKCILEAFDLQLTKKCFFVTDASSLALNDTIKDFQYLPCISQLLNKVVLESVRKPSEVVQLINTCFKLVNFLRRNGCAALANKLAHKSHHHYSLTIYKMLNSILVHLNEIEKVLQDKNVSKVFVLNKTQLVAIIYVLQPFEEAIETLEDNREPTIHLVMAYMHELRKFCQTTIDSYGSCSFVQQMQVNLLLHLEEIVVKNINALHKLAVFLYPPTNKLLPYSDQEKQSIEDECMCLLKNYKTDAEPLVKQEPNDTANKRKKLLADFLESESQCQNESEISRREIQNYKNIRVSFTGDFNAFNWWHLQKDNFPQLYKLSCTVLATPATSAASKHILLNAKSLLSQYYNRGNATAADIEKIMFINTNATGVELDRYFIN